MIRPVLMVLLIAGVPAGLAAAVAVPPVPENRLAPDDPAWARLAGQLAGERAITADFTEERHFSFRKEPAVLRGEVRLSSERGLSLHYLGPEEQTVIIDRKGSLVRTAAGDRAVPEDPRASAANFALIHLLRLDLAPLAQAFELYGRRVDGDWAIVLVPREDSLRRTLGEITVEGSGPAVSRIELRRSATQRVEIRVATPRTGAFSAEELRQYFR